MELFGLQLQGVVGNWHKYSIPVFCNLFAAGESSANVCVAHGTLCNDPSVYIATTA